jgi:hypothetical protein
MSDTIGSVEKNMKNIMRTWLESDPIALLVLALGIAAVELLALSI